MTARPPGGRKPTDRTVPPVHVIQFRLPVALYEWLRLQAFREHQSMSSIAVEALTVYRAEVDAGRTTVQGWASRGGETTLGNVRVDNDLYEWLRTTAFYAHTSISAVIVAALAHAQADHTEGTVAADAD